MALKLNGTNSVAAPAYAGADADTGLQCGTDEVNLVTGGTARLKIDSSGNIGIGTTTTDWSLLDGLIVQTANGSSGINIASASSSHNAYLAFGYGTSHADQFSASVGRVGDDTLVFGTANTERLRINSSGNVGIGATSLNNKLEVNGNQVLLANGQLKFADAGNSHIGVIKNSGASGNGQLEFLTGGTPTERMRIDTSGRLLVGTSSAHSDTDLVEFEAAAATSSQDVLIINGGQTGFLGTNDANTAQGIRFKACAYDSTNNVQELDTARIKFEKTGSWNSGGSPGAVSGKLIFEVASGTTASTTLTERMQIASTGDVGIGIAPAAQKLQVHESAASTESYVHITNAVSGSTSSDGLLVGLDTSANAILWNADNTVLKFGTNNSERMRIDNSGQLGIGTTSPGRLLEVKNSASGEVVAARFSNGQDNGSSDSASIVFGLARTGGLVHEAAKIRAKKEQAFTATPSTVDASLSFEIMQNENRYERLKIESIGRSMFFSEEAVTYMASAAGAGTSHALITGVHSNSTVSLRAFTNGNIQNTNNSYGSLSDSKLKENIVDANSQWNDIKDIRVRNYNFIEGETHTQLGVIAQEVETVSPGLVYETSDVDNDGNDLGTVTKSVNYSVLYMKAVKALQEAQTRIEALETQQADLLARITALEAA